MLKSLLLNPLRKKASTTILLALPLPTTQHPFTHNRNLSPQPMGSHHIRTLRWGHWPRRARQNLCHSCRLVQKWRCRFVQGLSHHHQRTSPWMVHIHASILHWLFRHPIPLIHHLVCRKSPLSGHPVVPPKRSTRRWRNASHLHWPIRKNVLWMENLTQEMILQCMALALKPEPFADNVCLWPTATMHELKLRVTDYIRMEKMKTLRTRFCVEYQPTGSKHTRPATISPMTPNHPTNPNTDPANVDHLDSLGMHR